MTMVVVAAAVFGAGVVVGAYALGRAGEPPCWQVQQDLEAAKSVVAETFGDGPEGEAALAQVQERTEDRPDCFSPATRDLLRRQREQRETQGSTPSEQPTAETTPSDAASDG